MAAAAAYMVFEAQWVLCRQEDLHVPELPPAWAGLTILHLSDVHAGLFPTNERALRKVVDWAGPLTPDLVFLTGDILGERDRSLRCLELIADLRPRLGTFAVTGNHEYGLGKGPLAHTRHTEDLWATFGITLLQDRCVSLYVPPHPAHDGLEPAGAGDHTPLVLCGADYLSAGFGLVEAGASRAAQATTRRTRWHAPAAGVPVQGAAAQPGAPRAPIIPPGAFPILLVHEPPVPSSPLAGLFPLAFAGHTHGGQIRVPGPQGLAPLNAEQDPRLAGLHAWGCGMLVISRGIGTSFLPMRLFTRPEATLWRLV